MPPPHEVSEEVSATEFHQVVWVGAEATDYAVSCEACEADGVWPDALQPTLVEGTLRREADVGFTTCWRGHRIRIRRIARLRVVAAR